MVFLKVLFSTVALVGSVLVYADQTEAGSANDGVIETTVKINFSKGDRDQLTASIVPYKGDGSYPRSGWISCRSVPEPWRTEVLKKMGLGREHVGFYHAKYKVTGPDKSVPMLAYMGEILSLKDWTPPTTEPRTSK